MYIYICIYITIVPTPAVFLNLYHVYGQRYVHVPAPLVRSYTTSVHASDSEDASLWFVSVCDRRVFVYRLPAAVAYQAHSTSLFLTLEHRSFLVMQHVAAERGHGGGPTGASGTERLGHDPVNGLAGSSSAFGRAGHDPAAGVVPHGTQALDDHVRSLMNIINAVPPEFLLADDPPPYISALMSSHLFAIQRMLDQPSFNTFMDMVMSKMYRRLKDLEAADAAGAGTSATDAAYESDEVIEVEDTAFESDEVILVSGGSSTSGME